LLRRGEIAALRWKNVDLAAGQIAVIQSASQTRTVVRYKEPKSGRSRTVALSATVLDGCVHIGCGKPRSCCGAALGFRMRRLFARVKMVCRYSRTP